LGENSFEEKVKLSKNNLEETDKMSKNSFEEKVKLSKKHFEEMDKMNKNNLEETVIMRDKRRKTRINKTVLFNAISHKVDDYFTL